MPAVVHVSPHADDEALGAPATLLLLRRAGWRVVNAVVSLGRPADRARRRAEAVDAARRAGFELVVREDASSVEDWVGALLADLAPAIVISPSPHDAHPSHEAVARATADACAAAVSPPMLWQWGLWADLRAPTLYVPFDVDVLAEAQHVLAAYAGELARNDYSRLLEARAVTHAVLGSERVFGFGSARASHLPYADLLTELRHVDRDWQPGAPRLLDDVSP